MNVALFAYSRQRLRHGAPRAWRLLRGLGHCSAVYHGAVCGGRGSRSHPAAPARDFYGPLLRGPRRLMIFISRASGLACAGGRAAPAQARPRPGGASCWTNWGSSSFPCCRATSAGPNELAEDARRLAWARTAVITTATDINGRFSVDAWAVQHELRHREPKPLAKAVSAAVLEGDVPFLSDFPVVTDPAARARAGRCRRARRIHRRL